jgi:phenylacetate-CoA ligase
MPQAGTTTEQLQAAQLAALRHLLATVLPSNAFYASKFSLHNTQRLETLADFAKLPLTTKAELVADQTANPPYGTAYTYARDRYSRFHQTSGTSTGKPLYWLDTGESWNWILGCWRTNFSLMGITGSDKLFFPFSFGPFLGFWSAFEAATHAGFLAMPGGGMTTTARLRFILDHGCTVLFATPTYALHLADVAEKEKLDIRASAVRALVVAGEPGGNINGTREKLGTVWGARVFDHYGLTEIGPVAVESHDAPGTMDILENDYYAEVLNPETGSPAAPGETGELILTNLGRYGSPLIRYRTGDVVRLANTPGTHSRNWRRLDGGILGRADDMIQVRGNNIYPSAIESIVRRFPGVAEYRVRVNNHDPLADLLLEVEPTSGDGIALAEAVSRAIRDELLFRVNVKPAPPGTLPRFEMKARRIIRYEQ